MRIEVPPVPFVDMQRAAPSESSARVAARVAAARSLQQARLAPWPDLRTNADATGRVLGEIAPLDAEGAANHPGRNRIYSCLGGTHAPQIEFSRRTLLQDGDIIALCSDGVWGPVGNQGLLLGLSGTNLLESVPKLMSKAEELGGANCDNLSMVTICWHDDLGEAVADSVSTQTMALHDFTTQMEAVQRTRGAATSVDLTDDEIERAIAEINSAIKKFTK